MALKLWIAASQMLAETSTYTVGGTPVAGDTAYITMNPTAPKTITYTVVTGDTISTVASGLVTLLNQAVDAEFQLASWSASAAVITAKAANPGEPFTAAGTGTLTCGATGGTTLTAASVQVNVSPNDVANTANWSGGSLPTNADTVLLENTDQGMYWNLSALSAITIASWKIRNTFAPTRSNNCWIGNLPVNPAGFREFRGTELTLTAATILEIAYADGAPANAFQFNTGSTAMTGKILGPGGQTPGAEVVSWRGTGTGNSWEVLGGSLVLQPEIFSSTGTAVCQTLKAIQGAIRLEAGTTINTSADLTDSALDTRVSIATHTQTGASAAVYRDTSASATAMTIDGGSVTWNSSGDIATLAIGAAGTIDFSNAKDTLTVGGAQGTVVLEAGFTYLDPQRRTVPWTADNTVLLDRCGVNDGTWDFGKSVYVNITAGP